jgi:hypothetical protein
VQVERCPLALSQLAATRQNIDALMTIETIFMAQHTKRLGRSEWCLFEKCHSNPCIGPPNKPTTTTYSFNHDVKLFRNILYRKYLHACAFFGEVRDPALDTRFMLSPCDKSIHAVNFVWLEIKIRTQDSRVLLLNERGLSVLRGYSLCESRNYQKNKTAFNATPIQTARHCLYKILTCADGKYEILTRAYAYKLRYGRVSAIFDERVHRRRTDFPTVDANRCASLCYLDRDQRSYTQLVLSLFNAAWKCLLLARKRTLIDLSVA